MADLRTLGPNQLKPWPGLNPRRRFDESKHHELVSSLKQHGNLQPVLVRLNDSEPHFVVAGERRWRAAQDAGVDLLCLVREDLELGHAIEMAGIENLHRDDISPLEEALWYRKLIEEAGKTQAEVAEIRGVDPATISNTLRLLELPDEITDLIDQGKLAPTNARDLLLPWMREEKPIREKFFRIVAQQLDFGATTGQHMSKPWLKEMVERVGKIAKPALEPKPAPKPGPAKKQAPAQKEPPNQDVKATAPTPSERAEASETSGNAESAMAPPAEGVPAAQKEPATAPAPPPADPIEVDLDAGAFAAATRIVGEVHHHLTFAVMPHANRPGEFSVIVSPKGRGGMPSMASESAIGTAETIEDEVRAALGRLVEKINDGRK